MFKSVMKFTLIVVVPVVLLGACFVWMLDPYHLSSPKDVKLVSIFQKNRAVFEELRNMAAQEGEAIIIPSEFNKKISLPRKAHYDSLLSKIGNPTLVSGSERIKWVYASAGIQRTGSEWTKGISFDVNCDKAQTRESLDKIPEPREDAVYCRTIDGNWRINVSIWI